MEILNIQSAAAGVKRIKGFLEAEERTIITEERKLKKYVNYQEPVMALNDVTFGYNQKGKKFWRIRI